MKRVLTLVPVLLAIHCGGSGSSATDGVAPGKGAEDDPLSNYGKADSFFEPTVHAHSMGSVDGADFKGHQRYHAFDFAVSGPATVTLETFRISGVDPVDTVIYLYQDRAGGWGDYIHMNDDISDDNEFSRLAGLNLKAGRYRLVVKAHSRGDEGSVAFRSRCAGAGCQASPEVDPMECRFGEYYFRFWEDSTFTAVRNYTYHRGDQLSDIEQAQFMLAVELAIGSVPRNLDEAFGLVEEWQVDFAERLDPATGVSYTGVTFNASEAGDNTVGAIYETDETEPLAQVVLQKIKHCTVGGFPADECRFGSDYRSFLEDPSLDTVSQSTLRSPSELSSIQQAQLIRIAQDIHGLNVETVEDAFEFVDNSEIDVVERRDRSTGVSYVALVFLGGDNRVGAIFKLGEKDPAATISDDDVYRCTVAAAH